MSAPTQTIHGIKACLALFDHRPHDIQRIFYREQVAKQLGVMLRWAASQGIVYRELDEEGMRRVAKSAHHEGLVLVTQPLCYGSLDAAMEEMEEAGGPQRWMALDGVENPHNLGAILRTAAFFGLEGLLAGGAAPRSRVNSAALRVAEGGAEFLRLCGAEGLAPALAQLGESGWRVTGLETDAPPLPGQGLPPMPWLLVVGHEHEGLSPAVRATCGAVYSIPGEGRLGSLNVSVATGIALSRLVTAPSASPPPYRARRGVTPGASPARPRPRRREAPERKRRPSRKRNS